MHIICSLCWIASVVRGKCDVKPCNMQQIKWWIIDDIKHFVTSSISIFQIDWNVHTIPYWKIKTKYYTPHHWDTIPWHMTICTPYIYEYNQQMHKYHTANSSIFSMANRKDKKIESKRIYDMANARCPMADVRCANSTIWSRIENWIGIENWT